MTTFSKRIKQLRLKAGFTVSQLSEKSGISRSRINDIENGRKLQGEDPYLILCKVFDVSLEYLMYGDRGKKDEIIKQLNHINESIRQLKEKIIDSN